MLLFVLCVRHAADWHGGEQHGQLRVPRLRRGAERRRVQAQEDQRTPLQVGMCLCLVIQLR